MITKIDNQKEINKIKKFFNEGNYFIGTRYEHTPLMILHRTKLLDDKLDYELYYSLTTLRIDTIINHFGFEKHSFSIKTYRRYKHYTLQSNNVKYSISYNSDRGVDIYVCETDINVHPNPEEVYYNFFKELMQIQNPDLDIELYYPEYIELKKVSSKWKSLKKNMMAKVSTILGGIFRKR